MPNGTEYTLDLDPNVEAKIFPSFTESRFTVSKEEKKIYGRKLKKNMALTHWNKKGNLHHNYQTLKKVN